jgi:hypothetical protein
MSTPERMPPDTFAALCYVLWHHQGGSSTIGQQVRPLLGLGPHERMSAEQAEAAKRVEVMEVEQC